MSQRATYLRAPEWVSRYNSEVFAADMIAAVIVAIMLIPQSLAYALLAGLPAEAGLYASILPLVAYALLGTSSTLSVGPVAITSLMTAAALSNVVAENNTDYLTGAVTLAALSGAILLGLGLLRFGFLANFLSHAVVSAFITASALIIALSQMRHILGVNAGGDNLLEILHSLTESIGDVHGPTLVIGLAMLSFLLLVRRFGTVYLCRLGMAPRSAAIVVKTAPVIGVLLSIAAVALLDLEASGVEVVGDIPPGIPVPGLPEFDPELIRELFLPAVLISLIGYVESISVGRTLGARRRERVNPDRELMGLGAANLAASVSGAFPVTGGFSRSVVNFDAGARTQAASIFTAVFIALVSIFLTPLLYNLPKAILAATIIIAVLALVDFSVIRKTWRFSRSDWLAVMLTILVTLVSGVEAGVSAGVLVSLALHLYRTSRPHIAEVGLVPGTEHFRNVLRYRVETVPEILSLRVDESLFFANANAVEELVFERLYRDDRIAHVVLSCTAVNEIDFSALEVMEELNHRLSEQGIILHLSELKGPVKDRLDRVDFQSRLSGHIYLSHYQAVQDISRRFDYGEVDKAVEQ